jgi:hypothetical protein
MVFETERHVFFGAFVQVFCDRGGKPGTNSEQSHIADSWIGRAWRHHLLDLTDAMFHLLDLKSSSILTKWITSWGYPSRLKHKS